MLRSLLWPFLHLPFDDTRIDAVAAGVGSFMAHFIQQRRIPGLKRLRRAAIAFRHPAFESLMTSGKRKAICIQPGPPGSLEHQRANHKMSQRQGIDFLTYARRRFATEVRRLAGTRRVLVRLLLSVTKFVFPTPMIPRDQFQHRIFACVQQIGKERVFFLMADTLWIVQRVLDHTHDDSLTILFSARALG